MTKLRQRDNSYFITNKVKFEPIRQFKQNSVETAFEFAYDMSFGSRGEHRNYRSGGSNRRKNGEIFINTFQGKLSEFGIYNELYDLVDMPEPDLETYGLENGMTVILKLIIKKFL